jgi:hypothetical protein
MTPQEKLQKYFEKIVEDLGAEVSVPVKAAIYAISENRRLLALRGYLRYPQMNRGEMADNWAWTKEKEQAFNSSKQKTEFDNEVDKVKKEFRRLKPGYYLTGEVKARSLEDQIRLWNDNKPMKDIVPVLKRQALREIARTSGSRTNPSLVYADDPAAADLERFRTWLAQDGLVASPTNATPGLSDHGQAKAIDFSVWKKGETRKEKGVTITEKDTQVAGQESKTMQTVWKDPGFSDALKNAAVGTKLVGPLLAPPEDWHYTFSETPSS